MVNKHYNISQKSIFNISALPAKTRKRLRRGGGPRPDTPVHSSSSSQSPLWNPSSPPSLHPPRDRALQRFSDVVSCSNCVGKQADVRGEGRAPSDGALPGRSHRNHRCHYPNWSYNPRGDQRGQMIKWPSAKRKCSFMTETTYIWRESECGEFGEFQHL